MQYTCQSCPENVHKNVHGTFTIKDLPLFPSVILLAHHIPLRFRGRCDLACHLVVKCHSLLKCYTSTTPENIQILQLWLSYCSTGENSNSFLQLSCSCQFCKVCVTQATDQIHPVHCHHHRVPSCDITGSPVSPSSMNTAFIMMAPYDHMGWPTDIHWQKTNSREESDIIIVVFLQSLLCQLCNLRDHLSKRKIALPVHLIEKRKRKRNAFLSLQWIASLSIEHTPS